MTKYDPALDPDYPLNRLADKYGAMVPLRNPRREGDRQSWPQVLNWRQRDRPPLAPLTLEQIVPAALFPPMWPLLGMAIWLRYADVVRRMG